MHALLVTSPVARSLAVLTFVAFLIAEVSIRIRGGAVRTGSSEDRGSIVAVVAGIAAGGAAAGWLAARVPAWEIPGKWVLFLCGLGLMWAGVLLRQWAVWALGRFFTVTVRVDEDHRVIDRGPFRWVRHPSYTGLLLTLAGVGLVMGNWLSLAALVALPATGLLIRIRVEERALMSSVPGYPEYARGRSRLIPGLW